jgi:hypothetical protein
LGLNFFCIDKHGHTAIDINLIEENWSERAEAKGKVSFELRFDPASLDRFVHDLTVSGETRTGKATLIGYKDDKDMYF